MRVNLHEQEYLSIEQIAQEWSKEPGKLQAKEIEQEIWKAYWLGHFVDENGEPTFMVPYKDREYFDKGPFYIHIVSESDEEEYDKESIEHAAIVYKEENGEFIPLHFWIRYLYSSSPTLVPLERFYTYFPENQKIIEEKHNAKFVAQIKTMVTEYRNVGKAVLSMEDAFIKTLIFDHILDLASKEVTKYTPLHRAFLFSYLHSSSLLEFRPKLLPKLSGKGEDAILMDADDEDYKSLSEQNLNFLDKEFENKRFLQAYLKPLIKPSHFIDVCVKLNVKVPQFLASLVKK